MVTLTNTLLQLFTYVNKRGKGYIFRSKAKKSHLSHKYLVWVVWVVHRATLYREGLIINVYRNLHKAVYKKEDFKRQDRRRSFSISLNFYQAILQSSPQTRFMFDIKKLYIITWCAKIYSWRNSTERGKLRSINPNSVKGDFHNPLTSRCETLDWQKLLAIL